MTTTATKPKPEQTEDSVLWFAHLAAARQKGDAAMIEQARLRLAELGIEVRLSEDGPAKRGRRHE